MKRSLSTTVAMHQPVPLLSIKEYLCGSSLQTLNVSVSSTIFLAAIQPLTVVQSVNIGTEGAIAICAALEFAALTKLDLSVFILMDLFF